MPDLRLTVLEERLVLVTVTVIVPVTDEVAPQSCGPGRRDPGSTLPPAVTAALHFSVLSA